MWARKLDEVVALDGVCCGMSAAGDDPPTAGAAPDSLRLHTRLARAYEELGAIADALIAIDRGSSSPDAKPRAGSPG
jgi:hypothetical protein